MYTSYLERYVQDYYFFDIDEKVQYNLSLAL